MIGPTVHLHPSPAPRFRRQFLRKMWPIQLAFRFLISCNNKFKIRLLSKLKCWVRCLICVTLYITGAQIPGVWWPWRLNFVQWCLIYSKKKYIYIYIYCIYCRFFPYKLCIGLHELRRKHQITVSVRPQSGIRFQITLLTLKSLAIIRRYLEKFQTLYMCK